MPRTVGGERVVLLDFGLVRETSGEALTTVGRFVGTPEYSAPEQIRGEAEIGPAADLYAAGVTAPVAGTPPAQGWYCFLPYHTRARGMELAVEGAVLQVKVQGAMELALDVTTGVPLNAEQREQLSTEEWGRRRDLLIDRLYEAAGRVQTRNPASGAELLAEYAKRFERPKEMISIAAYRATLLHLRSAPQVGPTAYENALSNIERALAAEPGPPRYRLLHGELLLKTGRSRELAKLLETWGRQEESRILIYEQSMLNILAGSPVDAKRFIAPWAKQEIPDPWRVLVKMVQANQGKAWQEMDSLLASLPKGWKQRWDLHQYWYAQSLLDRKSPDPHQAIEHLTRQALAGDSGMAVPVVTARLLAQVMAEDHADRSLWKDAKQELNRFRERVAFDLNMLYLKPLAEATYQRARDRSRQCFYRKNVA